MRACTLEHFETGDGTRLIYRAWLPAKPATRGGLVLFHRGHEHSARWQELVDSIDLPDFAIFAWDARGHGRSPGRRGHAPDFATLIRDADDFVHHLAHRYRIAMPDMAVLGHSVGAAIAAAWVHDTAPAIRLLMLASPALRVRLYVPFAIPLLRLLRRIRPDATIRSYVKGRLLSHDPVQARAYDEDPLVSRDIAVNLLLGLQEAGARLIADAAAINVPTLVLSSGADWVVDRTAQRRFYERLGALRKKWRSYPGFFHDTFHERRADLPVREVRRFVCREFATPAPVPWLGDGDRRGASFDATRCLMTPLPWWSPRRWRWALARTALVTVGRLSDGIRLGLERGFDSGAMLDYVYRERPSGRTVLGRLIDRRYLDMAGWRGIRERRRQVTAVLSEALKKVSCEGLHRHVVDVASGPGRYLLETLAEPRFADCSAHLQDLCERSLEAARALAAELGIYGITCTRGDAFDRDALAALQPQPTVAVVAGLFELYPDNEPLRRTLTGLAAALPPGGRLIYTNQLWHPQLEAIARVLNRERDGERWVMRCRSQAEIDQLVAGAGFIKERTRIDSGGLFSVSLARRGGGVARATVGRAA